MEKKEGELKKRIGEMFPSRNMMQEIDIEDLEKILDEAKQDFPNFDDAKGNFAFQVGRTEAWFEKWFGEAEK